MTCSKEELLQLIVAAAFVNNVKELKRMFALVQDDDLNMLIPPFEYPSEPSWRLVHYASRFDSTLLMQLLVKKQNCVDWHKKTGRGETVVDIALRYYRWRTLPYLCQVGIAINYAPKLATYIGDQDYFMMISLLACGVEFGPTALELAAKKSSNVAPDRWNLLSMPNRHNSFELLLADGYGPSTVFPLTAWQKEMMEKATGLSKQQLITVFPRHVKQLIGARLWIIRNRATEICIALQTLRISALELAEIVVAACGTPAQSLPAYIIWNLVICVKHFPSNKKI